MTIQEEIRDRVIANIAKACPEMLNADIVKLADKILQGEASQGVVIKAERLLPFISSNYKLSQHGVYVSVGNEALNEQGYVAVEPLI